MSLSETAVEVVKSANFLDRLIFQDTPVLLPGAFYHEGVMYYTLPIRMQKIITVGRGKAAHEELAEVEVTVAVHTGRGVFEYEEVACKEQGFNFPRTFTQATKIRWPRERMEMYLRGQNEQKDARTIYNELREIWFRHVEYTDDQYYTLTPLFAMGSYLYPLFQSVGYLHFNGTQASGKSQNLRLLQAFGLNTMLASNMTTSALFRTTAGNPGVICIDEAESFEGERGQELRLILNSGYNRAGTATRVDKIDDRFTVLEYATFTPKAIASINPLEPVLASRAVVVQMAPAIRPIPEFDADDPRWAEIRADLYEWAIEAAPAMAKHIALWNDGEGALRHTRAPKLQNRAWQIVQMYVILADFIGGPAMADPFIEFLGTYFEQTQRSQEDANRQHLLLKVLPRVFATKSAYDSGAKLALKDIHEVMSEYLEPDAREYFKTKQVSRYLISLGFKERSTHKGGTLVHITEDAVRTQMKRRRVEPFTEDSTWFAGESSYYSPAQPTMFAETPAPTEPDTIPDSENSWLDAYLPDS